MANKAKSMPQKKASGDVDSKSLQPEKSLRVSLVHGRTRHLGWAAFGLIVGMLLLLRLGAVGQGIGIALLAVGVFQGFKAVQTFLHPAGTFRVQGNNIQLPTGLCKGPELKVERANIEHVFFLRRSVPWTQAGPLLVIETGGESYVFPRDWFASDSDQRRIETALNRQLKLDAFS